MTLQDPLGLLLHLNRLLCASSPTTEGHFSRRAHVRKYLVDTLSLGFVFTLPAAPPSVFHAESRLPPCFLSSTAASPAAGAPRATLGQKVAVSSARPYCDSRMLSPSPSPSPLAGQMSPWTMMAVMACGGLMAPSQQEWRIVAARISDWGGALGWVLLDCVERGRCSRDGSAAGFVGGSCGSSYPSYCSSDGRTKEMQCKKMDVYSNAGAVVRGWMY